MDKVMYTSTKYILIEYGFDKQYSIHIANIFVCIILHNAAHPFDTPLAVHFKGRGCSYFLAPT